MHPQYKDHAKIKRKKGAEREKKGQAKEAELQGNKNNNRLAIPFKKPRNEITKAPLNISVEESGLF